MVYTKSLLKTENKSEWEWDQNLPFPFKVFSLLNEIAQMDINEKCEEAECQCLQPIQTADSEQRKNGGTYNCWVATQIIPIKSTKDLKNTEYVGHTHKSEKIFSK